MIENNPDPAPLAANGPAPGANLFALYQSAHIENLSLQMRTDALRAALQAISRGDKNPCFAAAKAISADDDLLAACRIARGLAR